MMRFPQPVFQAPDTPATPAPSAAPDTGAPSVSAPSSTPSTPADPVASSPTPSPSESADSSSFEFMFGPEGGDPLGDLLGSSPPEAAEPVPAPAQPAPAQPAKPAATTPESATPPTTATPAPTEATSPTTATQPSPNLDPYDPGTLAAHLAQNEEQVVQHVADSLFKLSDKDVEELESNAVGTIPKLLARAFVASQKNFLMQMAQIVPRMVQGQAEVTKRHSEAEGEFYKRWPDIKKDQHGPLVMKYAAVYRQMHPEASRKDMIDALGPMVMMAANIVPSVQQQSPVVPASPMASNGHRPPQPAPFVPAGPSAGGAIPSTAPQLSPVEAIFAGGEE